MEINIFKIKIMKMLYYNILKELVILLKLDLD